MKEDNRKELGETFDTTLKEGGAFARFANRPCISQDMPELARKKHLEKEVRHV